MLTFLVYFAACVASGGNADALPGRRDASATSAGLPLALCEDVEEIDRELWRSSKAHGPPKSLMDGLLTYAEAHADTYAGHWENWNGTVVFAFTDDPQHHLKPIREAAKSESLYKAWPVDVVRLAHSKRELEVAKRRLKSIICQFLDRSGDTIPAYLKPGGYINLDDVDKLRNRVRIDIRGDVAGYPTVEEISAIADALDDEFHEMVCVEGPLWDGSIRLPTVDDRFAPMADAGADPPALPDFIGTVEMRFDPGNPPDSDSTTLHLHAREDGCADGHGAERMLKPEVIESATEIRVAMGVIEFQGASRCMNFQWANIAIKLAAPIGRRMIVDGLKVPPRPLYPKRLRVPRHYRRDALASALAALAALAGVLWVFWRATRRCRRARDHTF